MSSFADQMMAESTKSATDIGPLLEMAAQAEKLEQEVADLEAALKAQKAALLELKQRQLPDAMAAAGVAEFKTNSGATIEVTDYVSGTFPKEPEKRAEAFDVLVQSGGAELIKNDVKLSFGRSQHNEALALAAELRQKGYEVEVKPDVNHQTLLAFVREKVRGGEELAYEKLGLYLGRVAKFHLPKSPRSGR